MFLCLSPSLSCSVMHVPVASSSAPVESLIGNRTIQSTRKSSVGTCTSLSADTVRRFAVGSASGRGERTQYRGTIDPVTIFISSADAGPVRWTGPQQTQRSPCNAADSVQRRRSRSLRTHRSPYREMRRHACTRSRPADRTYCACWTSTPLDRPRRSLSNSR